MRRSTFQFVIAIVGLSSCLLTQANRAYAQKANDRPELLTFYVMGDIPYAPREDEMLTQQIAELPEDGSFVVHVGDIKRGFMPCSSDVYERVSGILQTSKAPLFIIPGDNEWNDCLIPSAAWNHWEKYFMRFDQNWQHKLPVFRQLVREENFAFTQEGILFLGINLVGGRVHDAEEWKLRHQQNADWTAQNIARCGDELRGIVLFGHALPKPVHDDFFNPFNEQAKVFGKPVLYIHGDGHRWINDTPFDAKNIQRIQVDQGGIAPPLKVTVTRNPERLFRIDRRLPAEPNIP
ncbi:hypothetical protein [Thalassoglobus sp.]|uniref:hypothetical protein n=1 Tax=Thalassoglobus sp. TaxID=2795869 RepID=UPI003AA8DFAA